MNQYLKNALLLVILTLTACGTAVADELPGTTLAGLSDVQKYERAIHIMAMLLVGFGFLMVFVKRYGRSALTATYLLVSVALPLYFLKESYHGAGSSAGVIDKLILAEFAAASLLICAGAVLGRLKMHQYLLLGLFFVPFYTLNEWIVLNGGLGLITGKVVDTGGSIVIHAFGAIFGIAVAATMTTEQEYATPVECDETSDRYSLLGSMVLWVFWPSFCAALVAPADVPKTAVNVILALCGSTLATYFASVRLRGKISAADIANATLAGGVAIGSTCDLALPAAAFTIGILAGVVSTFGFAIIQARLTDAAKTVDTCGVLYLHGLPGLFGGIAALFVVSGINFGAQLTGILVTVVIAACSGLVTGKLVAALGRRAVPYVDSEEFECEEIEQSEPQTVIATGDLIA
ncbi:ammonium transporter Rh type B [Geobacter sp. OR-1]|uniref:ammonium transporter n=1 Tax=Geobacter sp. OR-1 TaxID=1266765 RepID=UPI000543AD51|nr:ammonium transporter [Geobacter sp. OR-1]GAM08157.1 ammonium transporter Rh type B [Geobacter sp. OR-1]